MNAIEPVRRAAAMQRISADPAFVLHSYDWSESSTIVEVFSLALGRTALVAKGAKKPTSNFRPVLLPLQALELSYSLDPNTDMGTLKSARWVSAYTLPKGDALLAGFYINELLLKLLPRLDAQAQLFGHYADCVAYLALQGKQSRQVADWTLPPGVDVALVLRVFELLLLRDLGHLPSLDMSASGHRLHGDDQQRYSLQAELGLCVSSAEGGAGSWPLAGARWWQIHAGLTAATPFRELLAVLLTWQPVERNALRLSLTHVLNQQLGGPLRTRQLLHAMSGRA